jgi:hypothetical protein
MIARPRALLCAAAALALAACSKSTERASPDPAPVGSASVKQDPAPIPTAGSGSGASSASGASMQSTLAVKLLAAPTQLTMADRPKFMVGVEVVNRGTTAVDPQLSTGCQLTVNGKESMVWNLAIGNGVREPSWHSLPPGQTATMSWPLGADLFDKPGDYHLVLTLGGQQSTADVHVTK